MPNAFSELMSSLEEQERTTLETLDELVHEPAVRRVLDSVAQRLEEVLAAETSAPLVWEPIDLSVNGKPVPPDIRSSWMFVLRANTTSGAERHPNSIQRVMSYRGAADLQTKPGEAWISNRLVCGEHAKVHDRWLRIPVGEWHRPVMGAENWVVVSFHTVPAEDLIEERPAVAGDGTRQRNYIA